MYRIIFTVLLSLNLIACSERHYSIDKCYTNEQGSLLLSFKLDKEFRKVHIDEYLDTMFFKGTTLDDFKWARDFSELTYFEEASNGLLLVKFTDGTEVSFGKIDQKCRKILAGHLGKYFKTVS